MEAERGLPRAAGQRLGLGGLSLCVRGLGRPESRLSTSAVGRAGHESVK